MQGKGVPGGVTCHCGVWKPATGTGGTCHLAGGGHLQLLARRDGGRDRAERGQAGGGDRQLQRLQGGGSLRGRKLGKEGTRKRKMAVVSKIEGEG